jgi:uncharacterized MAPEG superfamily protein
MTVPMWCLVIGVFLPYVWTPVQRRARRKQLGSADNKNPRLQQAQLTGTGARAVAAQKNAFEALAAFAPAVVLAHLCGADPVWSARLAAAWVVLRLGHGVCYLADADKARTAMFTLASGCTIGLFVLAARM